MESIKKGDKGIEKTIMDAITAGGDSILNQSVLQNIKQMLGGGYGSMAEALLGLPLDFIVEQNIPALSGQIARSIDRTNGLIMVLMKQALNHISAGMPLKSPELHFC